MSGLRRRIDLLQHLDVLRWVLPVLAFAIVLSHQVVEHFTGFRDLPWRQHFASQVLFYGIAGPLVVWVLFTGIQRSVEARERATGQLATLYDFSRRLATLTDDALYDAIVAFPREFLDTAGCSLLLFDDKSGVASTVATDGLAPAHDDLLHNYTFTTDGTRRCHTCVAQRANVIDWCPALPADLVRDGDIQSVVCLPLTRGATLVGRLNVYLARDEQPAEDTLQLLNAMTAEAAIAIESDRLRNREIETLYEVNAMLRRRVDDLDGALAQILENTLDACNAEAGAIVLRSESDDGMNVRVTAPDSFSIGEVHRIETLVGQRRGPVQVTEFNVSVQGGPARAVTAIPMLADDAVVGFLCLTHAHADAPNDRQLQLLTTVGGQIALMYQNTRYYARLESHAILEERSRLAREMHDGLAQGLGYLNMKAQHALRRLRQQRVSDIETDLTEIHDVVKGLYAEVRAAIEGLRTPFDPDQPFVANVEAYVAALSPRTDTVLTVEIEDPVDLPPSVTAHVLRIVQEALTNVLRHADATQCVVCIAKSDAGVRIAISDDGKGFDPETETAEPHFGIDSMRERVGMFGGQLDISSQRGRGTTVAVFLPHHILTTRSTL